MRDLQITTMCVLAAAAVVLSFSVSASAAKSSVEIINWSLEEPLWIDCKSKNDHLGWRKLGVKQSFQFRFHQNIWKTTEFYCMFLWHRGRNWQRFTVWHNLAISPARDMPAKCGNCVWRAQLDGVWLWSELNQNFVLGHKWYTNGTWKFPPV